MTETPHEPLVPVYVDLKDFPFTPLFRSRLFASTFHAQATDAEWRAGVTLWLKSWDQVPAGTLPADDIGLCRLAELGRDLKTWRKLKAMALHGWIVCTDGRLHHAVVAEGVMEAWGRKMDQRLRTAKARLEKLRKRLAQANPEECGHIEALIAEAIAQMSQAQVQAVGPRLTEDVEHGKQDGEAPVALSVTDDRKHGKRDGETTISVSVTDSVAGSKRQGQGQGQGHRQGERESALPTESAIPSAAATGGDRTGLRQTAVEAVLGAVEQAAETWFDQTRVAAPDDRSAVEAWVSAALDAGIPPKTVAAVISGVIDSQFAKLSDTDTGCPRSLRALLDSDVKSAIRAAVAVDAAPASVAGPVPARFAQRFTTATYRSWIKPCTITVQGTTAAVVAPDRCTRDMLSGRYEADLRACLGVDVVEVSIAP